MLLARLFARRDSRSPSRSLPRMHRPAAPRRRTHRPPHVELLEDRTLLSGWVIDAVGTLDDPGNDIEVDASGNIYVTGNFTGTRDFDPGPGTFNLTSAGTNDLFVAKYASDGSLVWAQRAGSNPLECCGSKLALDTARNIYVTGSFNGTVDIGSTIVSSSGGTDIYVAKLDSTGTFLWARSAGGTGWDHGSGIAADGAGTVYVVGGFEGTVDFDPSPSATINLTSAGSRDAFVWNLDMNGNFVSALPVGSTGFDHAHEVAFGAFGSVHIVGAFEATADFDPGPATYNLTSSGGRDVFVWRLDATGNLGWARAVGAPEGDDFGNGVAVDAIGNVYVTGRIGGTADLDPGAGTALFSSFSCMRTISVDGFVLKLDANGNFAWANQVAGTRDENELQTSGSPLALDGNANVYVVGSYYSKAVDFDAGPAPALISNRGSSDGYVWKLDGATGGFLWARSLGGTGYDDARGVAVDSSGNVFVTGEFSGTATFDVGMSDVSLTSAGGSDLYVAKITQDGGSILGRVFNDSNNNATDDSNEIRLKGWTVYIDQNANGQFDSGEPSTTTGLFGEYQFRHLAAGTYSVRQIVQAGWSQTLPAGGSAHTVTLATGEFVVRSFGNFNPAQSPAGWEPAPGGCKDLQTGLIWTLDQTTGSQWSFWAGQNAVLNVVQAGFSDWGLATIGQIQAAAAHGIFTQWQGGFQGWSTSLANTQGTLGWSHYSDTAVQGCTDTCWLAHNLLVRGSAVVHADDGDPNYGDTVTGWTTVTGQGRDGDFRIHASGSGSAKATWTFTAQPASQYKVLATWVSASSNANNAPYKIFEGSTLKKATTVNQRKAPSSKQGSGTTITWADLGTVTTTGGVIKVELANNASGNVVADMVRLVPISPTGVAAMVTSRDVRQRSVDAVIASHYFNNDDRENNVTLLDRLDRHTLRDLLRARRGR